MSFPLIPQPEVLTALCVKKAQAEGGGAVRQAGPLAEMPSRMTHGMLSPWQQQEDQQLGSYSCSRNPSGSYPMRKKARDEWRDFR